MKNRNIFYGYCYKNGEIVIQEDSAKVVKEICQLYMAGKSLLEIADVLNERKIEYMPNVIGWNKARIMRILENKSYVGDDKYPAIIEECVYETIQQLKKSRNRQKNMDRNADIFHLSLPVRCPNCNGIMKRRVDKRLENATRWDCQNPICKTVIGITDETLLSEITEVLNAAIINPEMILIPEEKENESSIESIKLNNEIVNAFDGINLEQDVIRDMMMRYVALKYSEIDSTVCRATWLKNVFFNSKPLSSFSVEFLHRTSDAITLYPDGSVGVILENKQEIKKEMDYGNSYS